MKNPCENCLVLGMCKGKLSTKKPRTRIAWLIMHCDLASQYMYIRNSVIDRDKANEIGKIFGFQITGREYSEEPM